MRKFYSPGEVIPGFGTVIQMTATAYEVEGIGFVPFTKVYPLVPATPLVIMTGTA